MPTTLPRRWVTETPEVRDYLEIARARWGDLPTTQLITRLMHEGSERVAVDPEVQRERRRAAWHSLSEKYPWPGPPAEEHLAKVREGWPE